MPIMGGDQMPAGDVFPAAWENHGTHRSTATSGCHLALTGICETAVAMLEWRNGLQLHSDDDDDNLIRSSYLYAYFKPDISASQSLMLQNILNYTQMKRPSKYHTIGNNDSSWAFVQNIGDISGRNQSVTSRQWPVEFSVLLTMENLST